MRKLAAESITTMSEHSATEIEAMRAHVDEQLAAADFPWIADNKKELADTLGIVDRAEGVAFRATFIIDPDNVIQHVTVNGLNVGRNPAETLRVLDALQTDELCPCNWAPGEEVLKPQAA